MVKQFLLFYLAAIAIFSVVAAVPNDDGRIINGVAVNIQQVPYMVRLMISKNRGGGTLIAPNYVVTAAHCVNGQDMSTITVVANITTTAEIGIRRKVIRMQVHPEYAPKTMYADIAVLQLDEPINGMTPLPLCAQPLKENDIIQVSGWGRMTATRKGIKTLQTAFEPVRSQADCEKVHSKYVKKHMFCASGYEEVGFCVGDSGGPGVFKGQLCGVVAFVRHCGAIGNLDAYTDVYSVREFINNFMLAN